MYRRTALAALALLFSPPLWAEHGWEAYDTTRPLYLEGRVASLLWGEPHARLELAPDAGARVPADLGARLVQRGPGDAGTAARLVKAAVPVLGDRIWQVQLPSLAELSVWGVPRPQIKERIAVIGYAGPPQERTPALRAEILVIGDKAYRLGSDPPAGNGPQAATPDPRETK